MTELTDTFANTAGNTLHNTDPTTAYTVDLSRLPSTALAISRDWISTETVRAARVLRYRRYYDGDHDAGLNQFMRELLRIKDNDDGFALNMMPSVVDTEAHRCIVQSIDAVEDKIKQVAQIADALQNANATQAVEDNSKDDPRLNPSAFIQEIMELNRFDILQGLTHTGALRDGNAFLMVSWDNVHKCVKWTFEEAFDGSTGMLAYYKSRNLREMTAAIKIWQEQSETEADQYYTRLNLYFPDRIEKYRALGQGVFEPFTDEGEASNILPWVNRKGEPLGIPVIHFANGGQHNFGTSELRNAISVQNALNRSNTSAVMIAELTAFSILVARGHEPPSGPIVPGMVYTIGTSPLESGQTADLTRLGGGDIAPILSMIDKERQLIADITRTPSAQLLGGSSTPSGEYLKQLEIGLLGKVRNFQTHAGAAWETVADMSWNVHAAFGDYQPPPYKRFRTNWRSAEIRNDTEIVQNAMVMDPVWGHEQTLRAVSDVYDLDENQIKDIVHEQRNAAPPGPTDNAPPAETPQVTVNPAKGTVKVNEPSISIGPTGDTAKSATNAPAIGKAKSTRTIQPITTEELQLLSRMHNAYVGGGG